MDQPSSKYLVPGAIVVAGALVALAIYTGGSSAPTASRQQRPQAVEDIRPVDENDHVRNGATAKLFVVEYSDTECPFCKVFHNTMKQVLATYPQDVAWVYRHLPIPQLHSKAIKESEATECAAELGGDLAFWNYLDELFNTTNSNDSLDPAELPRIAGRVGLDTNAFNECLTSGKYTEIIKQGIRDSLNAGIPPATPYSVILDRSGEVKGIINGAEPLENVRAKLDALLR